MELDDNVVDLSLSSIRSSPSIPANIPSSLNITAIVNNQSVPTMGHAHNRRILRPRTEPRSYVESPDILINGTFDRPRINGNSVGYTSDSSEGDMPPLAPIKEMSPSEIKQRDRCLKRLREELRAEEMKLVLLKKLKQSQQLKENVAVLQPSTTATPLQMDLPRGLSITPTTVKVPTQKNPPQPSVLSRHPISHKPGHGNAPPLLRGQLPPSRVTAHPIPLNTSPLNSRGANLSVPQPPRNYMNRGQGFPPGVKDLSPSVTITPAPPQQQKERPREDNQTPAQRQAAAKLALRKQLEKTLLQIPPPKPPPPEMHFIPNPSNTEFIYLVGLEHVVDVLTKETKIPLPPAPFACSQCNSDFTPVWKWDKIKGKVVICEQCVTNNVKKGLKAEHTNRLKTAFVKALQQEQEIEQRLAQNGSFTSSSPAASPVTPEIVSTPKPATPTPTPTPIPRHAVTPPAPSAQPTPPPPPPPQRNSHVPHQDKYSQNAAVQALHQQILRTISAGGPPAAAHMMQFSPLFYPYQLAMAQAVGSKNSSSNLAEIQRAADIQRQYLLDMIPGPGQRHNWKT